MVSITIEIIYAMKDPQKKKCLEDINQNTGIEISNPSVCDVEKDVTK